MKNCFFFFLPADNYLKIRICLLRQLICTAVVLALSILLGGGSLVFLSRGSWAQNDQVQEGNSSENLVTEVEPENQSLFEPVSTAGGPNRGTLSYVDYLSHILLF